MCRTIVQATAPAVYTQHARNPAHDVQIGGDATVLAPNYGSPFVHDLDRGRRYATLADFENFVKLTYLSPNLHHSGGTVCEPVDMPVNKRHLDMVYAHLRYSDKPFMGSVTAGQPGAGQSSSWPASRFGGDLGRSHGDDEPHQRVVAARVGRDDARRRAGLRRRTTRPAIITPFILAGAMAPTTDGRRRRPDAGRGAGRA